jgi:ribosomal protein S18 acetylase RimI-like enzyme
LAAQGFKLRLETEADLPFLRCLYVSTRWQELAPIIDWTEAQKVAFLESQFALQRQHYRTYYPLTEFAVLEKDGAPAGRLYVDRQATRLHVIDIALLPEWRGHGTGTALMHAVCAEARASAKKVSLAVEKFNPAQRLYQRLGFREVADEGVYWIMEWEATPDAAAGSHIS